jgi:YceI-like domain
MRGRVATDGTVIGRPRIDATSVDTENKKRDEHLRSNDLFDVQTAAKGEDGQRGRARPLSLW